MNDANQLKPAPYPDVLLAIASDFGTPTYVYFEAIIRERIQNLKTAFSELDVRLLYAMKANSSPSVLRVMLDEGLGIDAVSPAEGALAEMVGFRSTDIFFSANNMSDADIAWATGKRILINVGEETSLSRIASISPGAAISLRVNLEVGAGHHAHVVTGGRRSKFGIVADALPAAIEEAQERGLRLEGLHQHIGSGNLDVGPMIDSVARLVDVALALPAVKFVNIGGGLGIPYRPDESTTDLEALVSGLAPHFGRLAARGIRVWMEPGRYLVAEAGMLLVAVNATKDRGEVAFAGTNTGMGHLIRPALYGSYHGVWNLSNPNGLERTYDVVGNICESGDFIARDRGLQEVRIGDILAILDAGAYGMSMASEYNLRPLPAEVFVAGDGATRVTRRRETSEEVAMRHLSLWEAASKPETAPVNLPTDRHLERR